MIFLLGIQQIDLWQVLKLSFSLYLNFYLNFISDMHSKYIDCKMVWLGFKSPSVQLKIICTDFLNYRTLVDLSSTIVSIAENSGN